MKKAQIQIQETIMVVFIFIIIIIIGMNLFFNFQQSSIKQELEEFRLEQKINSILTLPDSSEFVYTQEGKKEETIDVIKLMGLKELTNKKQQYYFNKYGNMNITVYEVYPEKKTKECHDVEDLKQCGVWNVYQKIPIENNKKIIKKTPVSIYYSDTRDYTIGIMVVEIYNV